MITIAELKEWLTEVENEAEFVGIGDGGLDLQAIVVRGTETRSISYIEAGGIPLPEDMEDDEENEG